MTRCPVCATILGSHTLIKLRQCSDQRDKSRGIVRRELWAKTQRVELIRRLTT